MQRREIILQEPFTPGPGQLALINRDGHFVRLHPGQSAGAGDVVVVYDIDLTVDADLHAANRLFTSDYYPAASHGAWPDEKKLIAELVPESGAEVLEICCGAGRLAPTFIRGGNHVVAVDINEECIRSATLAEKEASAREGRPAVEYRVGDALQLPFADASFDLACIMDNSLGAFFGKRRQVLSELVRVCRRRVIVGLRQLPGVDDQIQIYTHGAGFLEFSQVHSLESFRQFLDVFPVAPHYRSGGERPWGGRIWFLIFDLGTDSAARRRST
jgi:ubiquinone/menaquinone biosynthesis C-methylase UbiE